MNFFLSSRWSVRLALIIIALLALIALTSQAKTDRAPHPVVAAV